LSHCTHIITHEWVMSRNINESCHTYKWVCAHISTSTNKFSQYALFRQVILCVTRLIHMRKIKYIAWHGWAYAWVHTWLTHMRKIKHT